MRDIATPPMSGWLETTLLAVGHAHVRMLGCGPLTGGYAVDGSRVRRAEEWVESERVCEFRLRSGRCSIPARPPSETRFLLPALLIVCYHPAAAALLSSQT